MGRTFVSVRQGIHQVSDRWARCARLLRADNRKPGERLALLAKFHQNEAFCACADELEGAVFSVFVEVLKKQAELEERLDVLEGKEPEKVKEGQTTLCQ